MLGTLTLMALVVLGYIEFPAWILVPVAVVNAFIGLHFPAEKAETLKARNAYWSVFFQSLPLQAILATLVYGLGYAIRLVVNQL